jgi:hypothetical protein
VNGDCCSLTTSRLSTVEAEELSVDFRDLGGEGPDLEGLDGEERRLCLLPVSLLRLILPKEVSSFDFYFVKCQICDKNNPSILKPGPEG